MVSKYYLKQIQQYPLLDAEQEAELSRRIRGGDARALDALVNSNLRLVVSIAHKFDSSRVPVMDLIQEGNMGLMVAARKFHFSFNTRFSTYAYPWIVQYMTRYVNTRTSFITLPHRKDDMIRRLQAARAALFQQRGREPSVAELAEYVGIPEPKVADFLRYDYTVASLDVEVNEGENLSDLLPDTTYSPERLLMDKEERRDVCGMLSRLTANERHVIWYRFNFGGDMQVKTLREISKIINVSPEAVRQTELRAIRHLRLAAVQAG